MRRFAQLYEGLDATTSTNAKVEAMVDYLASAPAEDAAWAVYLLSGNRPRRPIKRSLLRQWAREEADLAEWLFDACYETVGDLAETIALLLDTGNEARSEADVPLHVWMEQRLPALGRMDEAEQHRAVTGWWRGLDGRALFAFNKLLTGSMRVGVSHRLVVRALAEHGGVDAPTIAHRLMGHWTPSAAALRGLFDEETGDVDRSRPYPYFLASPLPSSSASPAESHGERSEWLAEWKWDGMRGQLVVRDGQVFLWSRGEELVGVQYPEIVDAARLLPDGSALDGEILAYDHDAQTPLPFAELQRRIGRKKVGPKLRREVPVVFMAYDLLEREGDDLRQAPLSERRAALEALLEGKPEVFLLSPVVDPAAGWEELDALRASGRERGVEGLMLKRLSSPYRAGRVRGDWWKWKCDPLEIDAVLIYAQHGRGRRANLSTDYTFGVWTDDEELVPIAKAYSGLSNEEIRELDRWIRDHTIERFGPVRSVPPEHVFELHFEGIAPSKRHKSGVALRFPRISRWRQDKKPREANTLADVEELLDAVG